MDADATVPEIKRTHFRRIGIIRVGIVVNTPGQLHFYKNIAGLLAQENHRVLLMISRSWDETMALAEENAAYEWMVFSKKSVGTQRLLRVPLDFRILLHACRRFNPDLLVGNGVYDAWLAALMDRPCIEFEDSEPFVNPAFYSTQYKTYSRFVSVFVTPEFFRFDWGSRQIRVASYKELSYLHPRWFKPDPKIFELMGLAPGEAYAVIRLNSFDAIHDIGRRGFTLQNVLNLTTELSKYAKVFISSERGLSAKLQSYALTLPKKRIHDVLWGATLLVTDTQTMATEAAILGIPVVRSNNFVGPRDMGNFIELERRYGLIKNTSEPLRAIAESIRMVQTPGVKVIWEARRERLMNDKIDMASFMSWFIAEYPSSVTQMKRDGEYQFKFR